MADGPLLPAPAPSPRRRCVVYVDGFNLYYGVLESNPSWKWLNLQSLFEALRPDEDVVAVQYFTALVEPDRHISPKRDRQRTYFKALATLPKLQRIEGKYQLRQVTCRAAACPRQLQYLSPEEKKTDVNLAVHLLDDALNARGDSVVIVAETPAAIRTLTALSVLSPDEIAPAFGGAATLRLAHPNVVAALPDRFKKVDRWTWFKNEEFLVAKAASSDATNWFRSLYLWLQRHPVYRPYRRGQRILGYHYEDIVLRADRTTSRGGEVSLLDLGTTDPLMNRLALELQAAKPMLHPDILAGAKDQREGETLKGFLTGLAGVQAMDARAVCEEAILPKIVVSAPQSTAHELIDYTKYCCRYLAPATVKGRELWVVAKSGTIRSAKEALFPTEFKPTQNWEINQAYVKGLDFLCPDYISACTQDDEFKAWREFLRAGGTKEAPDNGVEEFAMNFARERLSSRFKNIIEVDKLNLGYDLEGEDGSGQKVHIEVKGKSSDGDVELTGNEASAARKHASRFYLCVVSSIPESPTIHLVQDPDMIGDRDKLTIRTSEWKSGRWEAS